MALNSLQRLIEKCINSFSLASELVEGIAKASIGGEVNLLPVLREEIVCGGS